MRKITILLTMILPILSFASSVLPPAPTEANVQSSEACMSYASIMSNAIASDKNLNFSIQLPDMAWFSGISTPFNNSSTETVNNGVTTYYYYAKGININKKTHIPKDIQAGGSLCDVVSYQTARAAVLNKLKAAYKFVLNGQKISSSIENSGYGIYGINCNTNNTSSCKLFSGVLPNN